MAHDINNVMSRPLHLAILLFLLTGPAFSQASSFSQGQEAFARGDYSTAIRMFQEARKQASDPAELGKILDRLAYTYEKQGGFYESIPIREEHLHLFETGISDREGKARAQLKLGSALYEDFRYGESAKHFQMVYESIAAVQSDFGKVARFLAVCNTFALHAVLGNEKEFLTALVQLEKSAAELGTVPDTYPYDDQDLDLIFRSTFRVGSVLRYWLPKMGPELANEKAMVQAAVIQLYSELGQVALTEIPNRKDALRMWAASLLELAVTYREVGEYEKSFKTLEEIRKKLEDPKETSGNYDLARLRAETYHQLGMTRIILAALRKSLKEKRSEALTAVTFYGKALSAYKEISHRVGYVDTGNDVSDLLLVTGLEDPSDRNAFISVSQECVETARRVHYRKGLVTALFFTGKGAELLKDLEGARKAYEEAVTLLEEWTRGMGLTETGQETVRQETQELYKRLIDVLIRLKKPEEAFQVVERSKLQDIHRTVKLGSVVSPDPKLTGDLKKVETLTQRTGSVEKELALERSKPEDQQSRGRIEHLSQLLANTKSEFYSTINRIRTANPDFEKLVNIRPAEFAKIQKDIPTAALLVEYFPSDTELYLFLVTRESFTIKSVPFKREELDNLVKRFRRLAVRAPEGASTAELRKVSADLYRVLVSPIEKEVEACELLVIVPSGQLYYLPFQALAKEGEGYLVEKKPITYLTASDLLSVASQRTESPGGGLLVAFGNPDGSLPAASDEVMALKELFPEARIFLQKEATKEKVASLPPETRILHLATHGQFNHKDVNENYILFAGNGPEEASYLKQGEIYALRLSGVHLVTLSACQTALGDLNPGAEIASLAQAFSIAGTPSVLATLWSVADRSTAELMGEFYKGLKAGKTKAQALREAQIRLLRDPKYAHPFYWAPFILEGGW